MTINAEILKTFGYHRKKATDIMRQICVRVPHTTQSIYVTFIKYGKPYDHLIHLSSVDVKDAIKLCREKIAKAETSKRINKAQWEELLNKLIKHSA